MAIDRGGLNYTISVTDAFSKATEKFRTEMDLARASFAQFKSETQGVAAANASITVSMNQATAASQRKTRQLSAEEEAERKLTRVLKDRVVEERLRELALQKGVDLSTKKVRQLTVEQEAERKLLQAARSSAVARKVEEQAIQRGIDLTRKKIAAITVEQEAQAKVEAALRRRAVQERANELAQQAGLDFSKKKAKALSVEEEALARITRMERERAVSAKLQQLQDERFIGPQAPAAFTKNAKGQTVPAPADKETLTGLGLARQRLQQFQDQLQATNGTGNDLVFTFRRLFGVLALFQAARAIFTAFTDFIKAGIEFNRVIESTRLGIASLIIAVGQVRDSQGNLVENAQAFLLAQTEAVRQQRLLRAESLKTTATFEQLLETFQVALGPGIGAGLKIDEVRKFSIQISQAASAIGQSQAQLSEEIRSILSGTIQQRTTRIAAVLGITNEDIRRAKETGTLFQFLQKRFETFGIAGEEAAKTFEGLTGILKGAVQQLAGTAAAPLFDELKTTLQQIIDLILTVGENGAVLINPEAVKAVAPIFQGILQAIESIKAAISSLGFGDLASSAKIVGTALAVAGQVLGGILQGLVAGFNVVIGVIEQIAPLFVGQGKSLQEIVALVTKFTVIFGSAAATAGLMGFALNALISPFTQIISLVTTLLSGALKVLNVFLQLPGAILRSLASAAILAGIFIFIADQVRNLIGAIFDVNISLKDMVELISLGFVGGIVDAINFVEELAFKIKNGISEAFTSAAEAAINFITQAQIQIAAFTGSNELQLLSDQLLAQETAQDRARQIRRIGFERELADMRRQNEAKSLAFTDQIAKVVGDAAGKDALGQIPGTLKELLNGLTSMFSGLDLGFSNLAKGDKFSLDKILDLEGFQARLDAILKGQAENTPGLQVAPRGLPVTDEQRKALVDAEAKLAVTQQQIQAQQDLNRLERANKGENEIRLQQLVNQQRELQTQLETRRAQDALDLKKAQDAIGGAQGEEQRINLEAQLLTLKQQQIAEEELLKAKIEETNIELERQTKIVSGTLGEGFDQGLTDFANKFSSAFQAGIEISTGLLQSFTSFVSDSIVSAFDPTNDTSIKERFARFLQDIAKMILTQLIQLQVAKLILGFGLADGGSVPGGGSVGRAEGGSIPRRGRASLAHYGFGVRGLAKGGQATPPSNVDRRDTVPIWAQPGEFMQNLSAVQTYGRDFMEALNARAIDPIALRNLAGLSSTRSMRSIIRRGPGFASGGLISDQIARSAAAQAFQAGSPAATGGAQRAVVVASESAYDKLLAGGNNALLRFMRENKDTVRGILDRG